MLKGIVRTAAPEGVDSLTVEVNFGIAIRERLVPVYQENYDRLLDQLGDWQQKRNEAEDEADLLSAQTEIKQALYNAYEPTLPNGEINPDWVEARDELIELLAELAALRATQAAYQREVDITFNAWLKASAALNDIQSWETQPLIQAEKPHELEEFAVGDECTVYFQNDTTGLRVFASQFRRDSFLGQFADFDFLTPEQSYYFRALQPYQERYKPICRTGRVIRPVDGTYSDYTIAEVQLTPARSSANNQLSINDRAVAVCRSHGVNLHGFANGDEVVVVLDADFAETGKGTIISYKEPNLFIRCVPFFKGKRVRRFAFGYHPHLDNNFPYGVFNSSINTFRTSQLPYPPQMVNLPNFAPRFQRTYTNQPSPDTVVGFNIADAINDPETAVGVGGVMYATGSWNNTPTQEWRDAHPLFGALPYNNKYNASTDIDGATVQLTYGSLDESTSFYVKGDLYCCIAHGYSRRESDPSDTIPANQFPVWELRYVPAPNAGVISAPITNRRWNHDYTGTIFGFFYMATSQKTTGFGRVDWTETFGPTTGDWPVSAPTTNTSGAPYNMQMLLPNGDIV